jgi:His/Glu/Gln/Arg/opine family amino acid ABC transporter permease subunit
MTLQEKFILNFIEDDRWMYLVVGLRNTVVITFFALLLGVLIGLIVAVIRVTNEKTGKLKILDAVCRLYLTVIRGTPVVIQLLIIYYVVFAAVDINKIFTAVIAFGVNSGAYVAETFRGGIMGVDAGQMEAARSLGLNYRQAMLRIIMPQAIKSILPALGNEFIALLKETSVSGYIAVQDLTKAGDIIRSRTYEPFMPLVAVALIYLTIVLFLQFLLKKFEGRLNRSDRN